MNAYLFLLLLFGPLEDSQPVSPAAPENRILVLPPQIVSPQQEPWEGLALALALQSRVPAKTRLVPLTAYRKKLNEYGLSLVSRLSTATCLKLATDLDVDLLVFGLWQEDGLAMSIYHVHQRRLERHRWPDLADVEANDLPGRFAARLGMEIEGLDPAGYELYRVWASTYFADELDTAKEILSRLLDHHQTDWLFLQEYLDLFGDPLSGVSDAVELVNWRDRFFQKAHLERALAASKRLLGERYHPGDFAAHARILFAMGEVSEACTYLDKAETFGFETQSDLAALRAACNDLKKGLDREEVREIR